jgi:hypothetical integral membrane protein (TIGR02206 family)
MSGHFFDTYETVPSGVGFPMFGFCHLMWLAFAAVICSAACRTYRQASSKSRRAMLLGLTSLMLLNETWKQVILLDIGAFNWSYLPLHLCSINLFVCIAYALRPDRMVGEFLYAVCLPGAVIALFFPGWTSFPFLNFIHLNSFFIHIMLALFPLLLLAGGELRPSARHLPFFFLCLTAVAPRIYLIDKATNANFFFLNVPGTGNPLAWFEKYWGNPGYLAGFPILLIVVWTILYLPFEFRRRGITAPPELKGPAGKRRR